MKAARLNFLNFTACKKITAAENVPGSLPGGGIGSTLELENLTREVFTWTR